MKRGEKRILGATTSFTINAHVWLSSCSHCYNQICRSTHSNLYYIPYIRINCARDISVIITRNCMNPRENENRWVPAAFPSFAMRSPNLKEKLRLLIGTWVHTRCVRSDSIISAYTCSRLMVPRVFKSQP